MPKETSNSQGNDRKIYAQNPWNVRKTQRILEPNQYEVVLRNFKEC